MMLPALLLLASVPPHAEARATAYATARIVRGERLDFAAPKRAPDRQIRSIEQPRGEKVTLRLIEFQ